MLFATLDLAARTLVVAALAYASLVALTHWAVRRHRITPFGTWPRFIRRASDPVLLPLARRMAERPELTVRLFVNLRRFEHMVHAAEREIEDAFVKWLRREVWPWERAPEIYYDPRSLSSSGDETACLHAKCVVVDDARAFITSANLTEAAQSRNIEAGVLLEDAVFARALRRQLESLIDRGYVTRLRRGLDE